MTFDTAFLLALVGLLTPAIGYFFIYFQIICNLILLYYVIQKKTDEKIIFYSFSFYRSNRICNYNNFLQF